jgi:hypothetical protein
VSTTPPPSDPNSQQLQPVDRSKEINQLKQLAAQAKAVSDAYDKWIKNQTDAIAKTTKLSAQYKTFFGEALKGSNQLIQETIKQNQRQKDLNERIDDATKSIEAYGKASDEVSTKAVEGLKKQVDAWNKENDEAEKTKKLLGDIIAQRGLNNGAIEKQAKFQTNLNALTDKYSTHLGVANDTLGSFGRQLAQNLQLIGSFDQLISVGFKGFDKIKDVNKDFLQLQYTMSNVGKVNFASFANPGQALEASATRYRNQIAGMVKEYGISAEEASRTMGNFGNIKPFGQAAGDWQKTSGQIANFSMQLKITKGFSEDFTKSLVEQDIQGYGRGFEDVQKTLALTASAFDKTKMNASQFSQTMGTIVDQTRIYNTDVRSLTSVMSGVGSLNLQNAQQEQALATVVTRGSAGSSPQEQAKTLSAMYTTGVGKEAGMTGSFFEDRARLLDMNPVDVAKAKVFRGLQSMGVGTKLDLSSERNRLSTAGAIEASGIEGADIYAKTVMGQKGGNLEDVFKKLKEGDLTANTAEGQLKEINKKMDAWTWMSVNPFKAFAESMTLGVGEMFHGALTGIGGAVKSVPQQAMAPIAVGGVAGVLGLTHYGGKKILGNLSNFLGHSGEAAAQGAEEVAAKGAGSGLWRGLGEGALGLARKLPHKGWLGVGAGVIGAAGLLMANQGNSEAAELPGHHLPTAKSKPPGFNFGGMVAGGASFLGIGSETGGAKGSIQGAINGAISEGLAGAAIGGVAGLAVGGVGAIPGALTGGVIGAARGAGIGGLGGLIKSKDIENFTNSAIGGTSNIFSGDSAKGLVDVIGSALSGFWVNAFNSLKGLFQPINDLASYSLELLKNLVDFFVGGKGKGNGAISNVVTGAQSFGKSIGGPLGSAIDATAGFVGHVLGYDKKATSSQLAQIPGTSQYINSKALNPLEMAMADAKAAGVDIKVNSGYRSDEKQAALYESLHGKQAVALPGHSTHNLARGAVGLDIQNWAQAKPFLEKRGFKWMNHKNDPFHFDFMGQKGSGGNNNYDGLIAKIAADEGVDPALVKGMMERESQFNPNATSHAGAQGLMQLMPNTARHLGVKNSFDPAQSIRGGAKYIKQMLTKFHGNTQLALAAYNAGEGNVAKAGGIPQNGETPEYVSKVLANYGKYKNTPMGLASNSMTPGGSASPDVVIHQTNHYTISGNDKNLIKDISSAQAANNRKLASAMAAAKSKRPTVS